MYCGLCVRDRIAFCDERFATLSFKTTKNTRTQVRSPLILLKLFDIFDIFRYFHACVHLFVCVFYFIVLGFFSSIGTIKGKGHAKTRATKLFQYIYCINFFVNV